MPSSDGERERVRRRAADKEKGGSWSVGKWRVRDAHGRTDGRTGGVSRWSFGSQLKSGYAVYKKRSASANWVCQGKQVTELWHDVGRQTRRQALTARFPDLKNPAASFVTPVYFIKVIRGRVRIRQATLASVKPQVRGVLLRVGNKTCAPGALWRRGIKKTIKEAEALKEMKSIKAFIWWWLWKSLKGRQHVLFVQAFLKADNKDNIEGIYLCLFYFEIFCLF